MREPYYQNEFITLYNGDCLETLKRVPAGTVNCCITSPPYWGLRDYGKEDQLGLEDTPEEYVANLVRVFAEVRRVLKKNGTLWLNLGDSYAGSCSRVSTGRQGFGDPKEGLYKKSGQGLKDKDLVGIPWRVAFALQADGWYLRQDLIWHKLNPMPESVKDRCTKAHEYIFLLSKSQRYFFDAQAIREPCSPENVEDHKRRKTMDNKGDHGGTRTDLARSRDDYMSDDFMRNKRSVWTVNLKPYTGAHFAVYPLELILPCVLAGCPEGGMIIDPFNGAGTTGLAAGMNNRKYIGIELNEEYCETTKKRLEAAYSGLTPGEQSEGQMLLFQ